MADSMCHVHHAQCTMQYAMCTILQYPNLKTNLNVTKGKCLGYRSGARVLGLVVAGCLVWLGWWLVVLVLVQGVKYWF